MLKRTLIGIFKGFETTGENVKDPLLKTRYYKLPRDQVWQKVVDHLKKKRGYKVLHEVKNVGEIVVEGKTPFGRTLDITLTLFAITPMKTAIDIYSASRGSLGDLGANYRTIMKLYADFDRLFNDARIK
ncbi:MAG TPA: DUF1499 domain-containing protein [Bacilli bacterium]